MKYGIPCICKETHALTWDFYWENTVVILELYRMWDQHSSTILYSFSKYMSAYTTSLCSAKEI